MSKAPQIDVINELLEECLMAFPISSLLIGLYQQYQKRGFLTKKTIAGALYKSLQSAIGQQRKTCYTGSDHKKNAEPF